MFAPLSIRDLAAPLLSNAPEYAAVLVAYLDETGLNRQARYLSVAGFVAPIADWIKFEARWRKRMAPTGIATFHAQPCRGGHKDFKGMADRDRDALYADLATIIGEFQFKPISASMNLEAWRAVKQDEQFARRFPTPYSFCFDLCLQDINTFAELKNTPVAVVYAINEQFLKRAELVAQAYIASQNYFRWIVSCQPNRPEIVIPLQAADMMAYEVYCQWQFGMGSKAPPYHLLNRLFYDKIGHHYDREALEIAISIGPAGFVE